MGIRHCSLLSHPSCSFIAHAIRHCYQPVGGGGSPSDFYLCSLLASGTAALACVFLGVTVDRFGRRGILLLLMIFTGIASLVLLGLWDCEHPPSPQGGLGKEPSRGASDRLSRGSGPGLPRPDLAQIFHNPPPGHTTLSVLPISGCSEPPG